MRMKTKAVKLRAVFDPVYSISDSGIIDFKMLLIGLPFGVVTLSILLVVYHLTSGP